MRNVIVLLTALFVLFSILSCNNPPVSDDAQNINVSVKLPPGWARVDGPEIIDMPGLVGLVAFNSWGQKDFWAREKDERNPDGSGSLIYNKDIIASQIPAGGAYVALVATYGPISNQHPDEYSLNDLSGLYQSHDWLLNSAASAYFKDFYKSGEYLTLVVACSQNASDETVNQINEILKSWKFVNSSTEDN